MVGKLASLVLLRQLPLLQALSGKISQSKETVPRAMPLGITIVIEFDAGWPRTGKLLFIRNPSYGAVFAWLCVLSLKVVAPSEVARVGCPGITNPSPL